MTTLLRLAVATAVALLVLLPPATPAAAQPQEADAAQTAPERPTSAGTPVGISRVAPDQLKVHYYAPRRASARELASVLGELEGRSYQIVAQDGSLSQPISNVRTFGDVVVLYDRPERIASMVTVLAGLEDAEAAQQADRAATEPVVVEEYRPSYVSLKALQDALAPLRRVMWAPSDAQTAGAGMQVSNISMLQSPATIVMRDTPERVAEMRALLERLDVPPPQAQLTCWLLGGVDEGGDQLPPELADNLRRIVPFEGFRRLCVSMVRTSLVPGATQKLGSMYEGEGVTQRFELVLEPAGFDPATGSLPVSRLRFEATSGQQFETSVTLQAGEYTVLGVAGSEPLFVVLQVTPIEG